MFSEKNPAEVSARRPPASLRVAPESAPADAPLAAPRSAAAIALFLGMALALFATDIVTKALAFRHVAGVPVMLEEGTSAAAAIPKHDPMVVIPRVLALHLTINEGAVFGVGQGGRWVFVVFSLVAAAVIGAVFVRSRAASRGLHIALGCVLAGNLGNLFDRLRFGVVRDMLELFPGVKLPFGLRWPDGSDGLYPWIFNFADVCLVLGLLTLMIIMYRHDRRILREQQELGA